ncbi:MAG: glycosyltransferase, partial [Flavobacteriales bacterium]
MNAPVLLLVYNRPKTTRRVLERLKELGISDIYVSGDGPKTKQDKTLVDAVKTTVLEFDSIILKHQFSDENLGCKNGVIAGINWFFNQVDEGIILEDDCLPNQSFFSFCDTLLEQHRNDAGIGMIGGNNPLGKWQSESDYFFSRIGHVWGWATWKNRWERFNPELPELDDFLANKGFERAFGPTHLAKSRKELTLRALSGDINTWDYQWNAHLLISNSLAIVPEKNLVENIGFDEHGTHTKSKPDWISFETYELNIPKPNIETTPNLEYEMEVFLAKKANKKANRNFYEFEEIGRSETSSLKVVLINSTDIGGGAEKIAIQLHHQLLAKGHESTLLVSTKKSELESVVELNNDWKNQLSVLNPDIIHVHNLHGTQIQVNQLAELSTQFKILFTLHDSWLTTGSSNHPFELESSGLSLLDMQDWKAKLAQRKSAITNSAIRFTAPSQWMRERFFITHNIRPFFVPNAIAKCESTSVEIPSNRFILFVANNPESNPYKDFDTLVKSWKKANEALGENGVDLVCLGGKSNSKEKFGDHHFHRLERMRIEQINSFLTASLLVIQASKQDNAPLGILEAHQQKKKVLASLIG